MKNILKITQPFIFFIFFKYNNIYYSTITIFIIYVIYMICYKKKNLYINITIIMITSLTIALQNELFVKWKLTIIYTIIGLTIIIINYSQKQKNLLQKFIKLNNYVIMNHVWGYFFIIIGIINIYISYNYF